MPLYSEPKPKTKVLKVKKQLGMDAVDMSPEERRAASGMWDVKKNMANKEYVPTKRKVGYAKPQRGAKTGTAVGKAIKGIFGSKQRSTASSPKGMIKLSSNPNKREKQIATKREQGNSVCTPTSKLKRCRPDGK